MYFQQLYINLFLHSIVSPLDCTFYEPMPCGTSRVPYKKKSLNKKLFRSKPKKRTPATVMIVTMKNFLIGEPRKYHEIIKY